MKKWKHINFDQRKTISSGISHNMKVKDIAELLDFDPTGISREVKRNRIIVEPVKNNNDICPSLKRWPYVCTNCKKRYLDDCPYNKFVYNVKNAQLKADYNLKISRKGIDVNADEFRSIDYLIKNGIDNNKSIYQIKIENKDIINKSITTLYRYINKGYLTTQRMDLPYAVKYKKRKHNKKYEYSNNKIDRSNHTYLEYLSYIHDNPNCNVWQIDFLGAIKSDNNSIISLILPNLQLIIIDIIKNPDSRKVVEFFDQLEDKIGIENFIKLIPTILTDRDPCFNDIEGICYSKITGEERCKIFYCDPYVSNQKPNVENLNKQLRLFFSKKSSVDKYSKQDIKQINLTLLNKPLKSLDSYTPKEVFIKVFGKDIFNKLF